MNRKIAVLFGILSFTVVFLMNMNFQLTDALDDVLEQIRDGFNWHGIGVIAAMFLLSTVGFLIKEHLPKSVRAMFEIVLPIAWLWVVALILTN